MITRHEMVLLKKIQRQLSELAKLAEKHDKPDTVKHLNEESAVVGKVIAYFEDLERRKR